MTMRRDARNGTPDVVASFHFYVDIKGSDAASQAVFQECSALEVETEVFTYEEGGLNDHVHKLPGRIKIGDITLKKGIALLDGQTNFLWKWMLKTVKGDIDRREVSIVVVNQHGEEVQRWTLRDAFPTKWVGPALNSGQSNIAIQSLTLTHRGIDLSNA